MIRFENVGLRYGQGVEVLRGINLELQRGGFYYLTGKSGAGKTSLMRLIHMALMPTRGMVYIFNRDATSLSRSQRLKFRQRIGFVFQDFRLLPHLSVFDNVALPLWAQENKIKPNEIKKRVELLLGWVGLHNHLDYSPLTLSGGQQQSVAICRAVITQPRLLLADEPTGNVDEAMAEKLLTLFEFLHQQKTTIVLATHSMRLVEKFPHTKLILQNGIVTDSTVMPPSTENQPPDNQSPENQAPEHQDQIVGSSGINTLSTQL